MAWLTAGCDRPSSAAAREKLSRRATTAKQPRSRSDGPASTAPVSAISPANRSGSGQRHTRIVASMSRFPATTVLGYPRIGPRRELKRALESYWDGALPRDELLAVGTALRAGSWARLAELGLEGLPSNTFSLYDHVLDAAMMIG